MNQQTTTSAVWPAAQDDAPFHIASPRKSLGLVEMKNPQSVYSVEVKDDGNAQGDEQPSTAQDLLQLFLAMESSRQEMETYNRHLGKVHGDFLASISHEMRSLLNGIIGTTSVLLSRNLGHVEREEIETIRQASQSLRAIVDDVLSLSARR